MPKKTTVVSTKTPNKLTLEAADYFTDGVKITIRNAVTGAALAVVIEQEDLEAALKNLRNENDERFWGWAYYTPHKLGTGYIWDTETEVMRVVTESGSHKCELTPKDMDNTHKLEPYQVAAIEE